jgi:hypothetical protein
MLIVKRKSRIPFLGLARFMKNWDPKRCALSGETEKHQTPYPPPWMSMRKRNVQPKYYPLEIDHINEVEYDNRTSNLRWLTKTEHIVKSQFVINRRPRKGSTTSRVFPKPKVVIDKLGQKLLSPMIH